MVKIIVNEVGLGTCALTKRESTDGLKVTFDGEEPKFLSWKAFKQLIGLRMPTKATATSTPPIDRMAMPAK